MILRPPPEKRVPQVRKHLSADALVASLRSDFGKIPDHRGRESAVCLADALMSAFAMFSLKDPSLLAFDGRRNDDNMRSLFGISRVPSDTQMREILDLVDPQQLRPSFDDVFRKLQRGKALESFVFYQGCYLLSLDGTGYFSSSSIHCDSCLEKTNKQTGEVTYHHQMLAAVVMHPEHREVIPLAPEPRREAGRQRQERLRAKRSQTVAAADPRRTPSSEADCRGGWIGQQRPAYPGTAGPRHALHPGGKTGGSSVLVRSGPGGLRGGPRDDDLLDQ